MNKIFNVLELQKLYRFFLLMIFAGLVNSQVFASSQVKIKGIVKDQKSGIPISFAHIYIPELSLGTASNLQGEFKFELVKIDSITISAIGYIGQVIYLHDSVFEDKLTLNVSLIPKAYELAEVKIRAYPTYSELKRKILEYEMTPEEINMESLMKAFERNMAMLSRRSKPLDHMNDGGGFSVGSPVTAIYNLFSRDAKNEKKLRKLLIADNLKKKVGERLSFELVSTLTGLKDKKEVADFIKYCNFDDLFVLAATDIQLYETIVERYKVYTLSKTSS